MTFDFTKGDRINKPECIKMTESPIEIRVF